MFGDAYAYVCARTAHQAAALLMIRCAPVSAAHKASLDVAAAIAWRATKEFGSAGK